jgi:hypothetical protein
LFTLTVSSSYTYVVLGIDWTAKARGRESARATESVLSGWGRQEKRKGETPPTHTQLSRNYAGRGYGIKLVGLTADVVPLSTDAGPERVDGIVVGSGSVGGRKREIGKRALGRMRATGE